MAKKFSIPGLSVSPATLLESKPFLSKINSYLPPELSREAASILDSKYGRKVAKLLPDQLVSALGTLTGGIFDAGDAVRDIERRADPQQTIHWQIQLPEVGTDLPDYYVEDVVLSQKTIAVEQIHRSNSYQHIPGFVTFDGMTLILYEDIRGKATRFFQHWSELVEKNGLYGRPSDYRRQVIVRLHDPKSITSVVAKVQKCWPISVNSYHMSSSDNDRLRVEVQFVNDVVRWTVEGQGGNTQSFLEGIGIDLGGVFKTGNASMDGFLDSALRSGVKKILRV